MSITINVNLAEVGIYTHHNAKQIDPFQRYITTGLNDDRSTIRYKQTVCLGEAPSIHQQLSTMPKKKKNVENGFSLFMKEKMPELKRQGYTFPNGFQDVSAVAHPLWTALSEYERKSFNDRAKGKRSENRNIGNIDIDDRLDSMGCRMSDRVDETRVEEMRRQDQNNWAKSWPPGKAVVDEVFYFVGIQSISPAINELIRPGSSETQNRWLPGEIAIMEYTLVSGKLREMHTFIKPGKIPQGWSYDCRAHTERTNKIPITGHDDSQDNYVEICTGVCQFLDPQRQKELPPVIVEYDQRNKVESCLRWLAYNAGMPNRVRRVFTLEYFIVDLYNHMNKVTTVQAVDTVLSRTVFDFIPGTCCSFHEDEEVSAVHCALGTVNKYCYMISDLMANEYDIELTGRHLPERGDGPPTYNILPTDVFRGGPSRPLVNKPSRPNTQDINAVQKTTTMVKLQRQVDPTYPDHLDAEGGSLLDADKGRVIVKSTTSEEPALRLPANIGFANQITTLQQTQAEAWPELGAEISRKPRIKQKKQTSPVKPQSVLTQQQQQQRQQQQPIRQQHPYQSQSVNREDKLNSDQPVPMLMGRGVPVQRFVPPPPGPMPSKGYVNYRVETDVSRVGTMPVYGRGTPPTVIGRGRGILPPPGFSNRHLDALTSELWGLTTNKD